MIAFPSMLVDAARLAGMSVPPDPDNYSREDYPHFAVFCKLQLGRSMSFSGEHFANAKVIAPIPVKRLKRMFLSEFIAAGLSI